jgi:hypothetical protein
MSAITMITTISGKPRPPMSCSPSLELLHLLLFYNIYKQKARTARVHENFPLREIAALLPDR